jgi:hypothetical protein
MNAQNTSSYNKIVWMAILFADILQDGDLPVRSVGVYIHFNHIVFYAPSERIRSERVKQKGKRQPVTNCNTLVSVLIGIIKVAIQVDLWQMLIGVFQGEQIERGEQYIIGEKNLLSREISLGCAVIVMPPGHLNCQAKKRCNF